ncbi:MAG: hypothetical protein QOF51_2240, partial [Chloroflexota bacterium]|nr:hypothetical protein [Chloroflexota bacterium]
MARTALAIENVFFEAQDTSVLEIPD